MTLTDQDCVFFLLEENKAAVCAEHTMLNADSILLREYDWGKTTDHLNHPFDIVLVSDCVLPKLYPIEPLVQAVAAVMGSHTIALFSYEHRPYPYFDPRFEFERLAGLYGLSVKNIPLTDHHPIYCKEDIEIWEVRRVTAPATISEAIMGVAARQKNM